MHSKNLSDKILQIQPKLKDPKNYVKLIQGMETLGPSCFFDSLPTEEQAQGAIALLDWLEKHLDYVPESA